MKRRIAAASVTAIAIALGWPATSALAGEDYDEISTPTLPFEQVAEGHVCNPVRTESGGIVKEGGSDIPATSSGSYICGQQASLPPANTPADAMPPTSDLVIGERHSLPDVYFALGSAGLSDRAIAQVDYFTYYEVIKVPVQTVRITGYADELGSARSNLLLSKRRAEAVAAFMETKGVPRSHMIITGAGEIKGGVREANRRVEVTAE